MASTAAGASATSSSSSSTKTVHPCVLSGSAATRGVECSVWATLAEGRSVLVTAAASTLRLYTHLTGSASSAAVAASSQQQLTCLATIPVAGNVIFLDRLPGGGAAQNSSNDSNAHHNTHDYNTYDDALIVGWGGSPARVSIVMYDAIHKSLPALALVDLTPYQPTNWASIDATFALSLRASRKSAALAIVIEGGTCVVVCELALANGTWHVGSYSSSSPAQAHTTKTIIPYRIPLYNLAPHLPTASARATTTANTNASVNVNAPSDNTNSKGTGDTLQALAGHNLPIATGWGEMIYHTFLHDTSDNVDDWWLVLHGNTTPSTRLATVATQTLYLTCVAVHSLQKRAAWLWTTPVTADAYSLYCPDNNNTNNNSNLKNNAIIVILGVNTWTTMNAAGVLLQRVAVNGWAHTTATPVLADRITPNPLVPLSIALDGCTWTWWNNDGTETNHGRGKHNNNADKGQANKTSDSALGSSSLRALLVLRTGHVYVWQALPTIHDNDNQHDADVDMTPTYTLLPTGYQLEGMGAVAHASSMVNSSQQLWLVGSRLGDSYLLRVQGQRFGVSSELPPQVLPNLLTMPWTMVEKGKGLSAVEQEDSATVGTSLADDDAYEAMLRSEEEALYTVIPPDDDNGDNSNAVPKTKRPRNQQHLSLWSSWTALSKLTVMDTLVNVGPIGPATEGPISPTPAWAINEEAEIIADDNDKIVTTAAPAHIVPIGFGSSGGLAYMTLPGRDDRFILAEHDVAQVQAVWGTPTGWVWMSPWRLLRINSTETSSSNNHSVSCTQVPLEDVLPTKGGLTASDISKLQLLHVETMGPEVVFLLVVDAEKGIYRYHTLQESLKGRFKSLSTGTIDGQHLKSVTKAVPLHQSSTNAKRKKLQSVLSLVWDDGSATLVTVDATSGKVMRTFVLPDVSVEDAEAEGEQPMLIDDVEDDTGNTQELDADDQALRAYYAKTKIVATDIFSAPSDFFDDAMGDRAIGETLPTTNNIESGNLPRYAIDFDDEDLELYGLLPSGQSQPTPESSHQSQPEQSSSSSQKKNQKQRQSATFVAVTRQSGVMEIYLVSEKGEAPSTSCVWSCDGVAQGLSVLQSKDGMMPPKEEMARSHTQSVKELKFFSCGPTAVTMRTSVSNDNGAAASAKSSNKTFCLAMETTAGDVLLYTWMGTYFVRQALGTVTRTSQAQGRHRTKLSNKGIIPKDSTSASDDAAPFFEFNCLDVFQGLSGQDGLFVRTARPFWIVADRGIPTVLYHRARHAAPAGGKSRIVNGFCTVNDGYFLTLHERVGRVGSQRLTLFNGISNVLLSQNNNGNNHDHDDGGHDGNGILTGDGLAMERKIFGVTVRRIQFIDDPLISSGDHPLYAMLISRELEVDQSFLNNDGLSAKEREVAKKEKEDEKIRKQVEADLGGFDFEHEWVEEITREDYFQVEESLGGAPPVLQEAFSLWIVDAADDWRILASYDLDADEHGMTLQIMNLSNFKEEPGKKEQGDNVDDDEDAIPEELDETLFIMVGTGTVDHNGEDVSGKGRALLFGITTQEQPGIGGVSAGKMNVALSLVYEKEIFHGPVTTLTCLTAEGKHRLLIGAGCDINLEQWGNGKLTQVGFFRATMQIVDIRMFKSFLLLSDAYDSLYLLIYRESDKSLTLLAKEYEPVAVYAAGLLSRGPSMTFVQHDDRHNLQFLQYAPGEAAARGGNKLVCRADYHLGTQTIHFGNHYCRNSLMVHSATPTSTMAALQQQDTYIGRAEDDQKISIHFGTTDGTVGAIVPLSEPVFWRLAALQSVLANALEPNCGQSSRAWRLYRRSPRRGGCRSNDRKKSVIDGDLVFLYNALSTREQEDFASAVGSTVDVILDNLLEIQCGSLLL